MIPYIQVLNLKWHGTKCENILYQSYWPLFLCLEIKKEKYWNKEHNEWTKEGREKNKYEYASKTTVNQRRVFSISCPKMGALESV